MHEPDMKIPIYNSIYSNSYKNKYKPVNFELINNLNLKKLIQKIFSENFKEIT